MSHIIRIVTRPISAGEFALLDRDSTLVALLPAAIETADPELVNAILNRRSLVIACDEGHLRGFRLAAAMLSDYFAIREGATVAWSDSGSAGAIAARIGERFRELLLEEPELSAARTVELGLADALVAETADWVEWLGGWLGRRSVRALLSAASLIRRGRSPLLERYEFGRLFAEGEPQRGLGGFLAKEPLDFSERFEMETI